ncbi:hypothetical protein NA56DRAFT_713443 [Hyaloscypha hepaticicola]|uniref:Uncharacterized protein n=1 Tax=Hyaloscypha hepaticicola TaxID=2082293 RepID=A0A2J6PDU9_9HELO|nr:hypothetical protein NA56DRAFT_713443 [Hyaloscypha hepaticicola]
MTSWSVRPVEERPDPDVIVTEVDRVDREDGSGELKSVPALDLVAQFEREVGEYVKFCEKS